MSTPLRRQREADALAYQAEVDDGIDAAERAGVGAGEIGGIPTNLAPSTEAAWRWLEIGANRERERMLALITEQEAGLTDLDKLIVLTDLRDRIGEA